MTRRSIRWSDNDRYFGPFTYAHDQRYRQIAVMLGSGDGDDYPGCRLRISVASHTLIITLPAIIKPWRRWHDITTEPTRSQMMEAGRKPGYWDQHEREFGFSAVEGALHWHYGPQTHDSDTTKSALWLFPWREHECVRRSLYDLAGEHFADLPQGRWSRNRSTVQHAIEGACPTAKFEFRDYDQELITATCRIDEWEWRRGKGIFRLFFLGRNPVRRSLDIRFSGEVGRRKGSWKGGTIGHSIDMQPGELHEAAFKRYCQQQQLEFVGSADGLTPANT